MHMLLSLLVALQIGHAVVRGRVVDARTGAPLERVLVAGEETGISTYTDADGRFELRLQPGPVKLFVSLVGYALVRRDAESSGHPLELTIPLVEGTGTRQEFVTERADGTVGGWRVEVVPGERFTYGTIRDGAWRHHLQFDLARPVDAPPPPWGHEVRPSQRP